MKCNWFICFIILCFTLILSAQGIAEDIIGVGAKLPSFFLKDVNGNNFFLNECLGGQNGEAPNAVIFSFCASYCKPCKKEIPELGKLQKKYHNKGLSVYLVALEKKELAETIIEETQTELPILIDRYLVVQKLMGFSGIPYTVLVDCEGIVRYVNTGFSEENAVETMENFEKALVDVLGLHTNTAGGK